MNTLDMRGVRDGTSRAVTIGAAMLATSTAVTGCGRTGTSGPSTGSGSPTAVMAASTAPAPTPGFTAQISKIPSGATLGGSWHPGCPVAASGLRSIDMPYWSMDGRRHPGRLIVNASAAADIVEVFHRLYDRHYPIRLMQPIDAYRGSDEASIEADNTSGFNCRHVAGSRTWSQHAYGLAIDINPCENPYVRADGSVVPPRCATYRDRSRHDPGLIHSADATVRAFGSIGWGWGGSWHETKDYQHFSSTGR